MLLYSLNFAKVNNYTKISISKSMANKEYAAELNAKCDAMLEKYTKIAEEVFESVLSRLE